MAEPESLQLIRKDLADHARILTEHTHQLIAVDKAEALRQQADEHLDELGSLYREVARIAAPRGRFVLVGYHPHFMLNGIPTHFNGADGQPVAIETHVHLMSDHVKAAHRSGWSLAELEEGLVDAAWLAKKPKWSRYEHHPVSFAAVWRRS